MATINAIAHPNELTKDVTNDFYLTPQVTASLTADDIIGRLRSREIATKNVDGAAFIQTFLDECITASAEGNNIVTNFFRSSIGIQGVIYDSELGHNIPAERLKVSVNLTQGEAARKAIEGTTIHVFEQTAATGPVIQSIVNPISRASGTLQIGGMALIEGMRLSLKGNDTTVGINFTKTGDSTNVFIPAANVYPNTPTKLQFTLPTNMSNGDWEVSVTTQASSNGSALLKEPRTYQYHKVVTVSGGGEKPDDL